MINKTSRVLAIIVLVLGLLAVSNGLRAQNIVRKGNMFINVDSLKRETIKTPYTYRDNGKVDTIWLTSNGKAFVWRTSKKTGKQYRKYLPQVTEQIGNEAKNNSGRH